VEAKAWVPEPGPAKAKAKAQVSVLAWELVPVCIWDQVQALAKAWVPVKVPVKVPVPDRKKTDRILRETTKLPTPPKDSAYFASVYFELYR
jgi:hypothetical protein